MPKNPARKAFRNKEISRILLSFTLIFEKANNYLPLKTKKPLFFNQEIAA